jgi:hypothetical protein
MALNVGLDVSFDNMKDWKGILERAGDVNSTKTQNQIMTLLLNSRLALLGFSLRKEALGVCVATVYIHG